MLKNPRLSALVKIHLLEMVEEAAKAWTLELTRAGVELAHATQRIQPAFQDFSERSESRG